MKKVFKYFLLIILLFTIFNNFTIVKAVNVKIDSSGNYYFNYVPLDTTSYYNSLSNVEDSLFKEELHNIISSGNITQFTYDDVKEKLKDLDEDPNNPNNIICVLTGKSMDKNAFGGSGRNYWNREHIWPKAHGFNSEGLMPYTDLHHLRAAEQYTNSTFHNDYDYCDILNGGTSDDFGNLYVNKDNSSTGYPMYEPRDAVKGDIARMIMYMDVRYEGDEASDNIELSIVNNNTSASSTNGYIGFLDSLVRWHVEDPVDDLERKRNDEVYKLQGNRNPFIDHPEYANIIYNANYDVLDEEEYRVLYYVDNGKFNYSDITQYKAGELVKKPSTDPISNRYDYVFKGWCDETGKLFDFENDTITSTLKLYAVWEYTPLPAYQMFEKLNTLTALRLRYELEEIDEEPILQNTTIKVLSSGGQIANSKKNSKYICDEHLEYNKNDLQVIYETNNKSNAYIGKNEIRLYPGGGNGTGLRIEAREGKNATIVSVSGYKESSNLTVSVAPYGSYAYLQNTSTKTSGTENQVILTSFVVTYYVETVKEKPVFEKVDIAFGIELQKDMYNDLLESGSNVSFGIKIDNVNYDVNVKVNDDYVELSKTITPTNYSTVSNAQMYVNIDGVYYYCNTVSNSVKTIANKYITEYINLDIIYEHRIALKYIINS